MATDWEQERENSEKQNNRDMQKAVRSSNADYDDMIEDADSYYDKQIGAVADWEKTQTDLQNEQTDFAIEKIEQQKDQAHSDYIKEQSGAYKDWQKQSNAYGANAEAMAAQGMANSGYSESSQVSMYNTYQNRVATARESYNRAVLNYDNAITEARLQNSSALAQIAYESLQKQLELSLAGFQYKNTLVLERAKTKREIESEYFSRLQSTLSDINTRESMANTKSYQDAQIALEREKFAWQKAQAASSGSSGGSGSSSKSTKKTTNKVKTSGKKSQISAKFDTNDANNVGETSGATIDTKSVIALGKGPLTGEELSNLVGLGVISAYEENGKKKFKNNITGSGAGKLNRVGIHSIRLDGKG